MASARPASEGAGIVHALLALPRPSGLRGRGGQRELRLLERWLASEPIREAMGVNAWDGQEWLDGARFASLLAWAQRLETIETGTGGDPALAERLLTAAEKAGYRIDRIRAELADPDATPSSGPRSARPPKARRERPS
jgi:hypothetical protein